MFARRGLGFCCMVLELSRFRRTSLILIGSLVGLSAPILLVGTSGAGGPVTPVPLSQQELDATRGGVNVTFFSPQGPRNSALDNLDFQYNFNNQILATDNVNLRIMAEGTKTAQATVTTTGAPNYLGTWQTRTDWPYPGGRSVTLEAYNPIDEMWWASHTDANLHSVDANVKVHEIKFWNLRDQFNFTSVAGWQAEQLVDRLNTITYDPQTTDSIDAVFDQCSTGFQQQQFRYTGIDTIDLTVTPSCIVMFPQGFDCVTTGPSLLCHDQIFDRILEDDPNLEKIHITFTGNNPCSAGGWNSLGRACPADPNTQCTAPGTSNNCCNNWSPTNAYQNQYWMMAQSSFIADPYTMTIILAHEIGHFWLGHVDDNEPWDTNPACASPGAASADNLMCQNGGRLLNSSQCSTMYNTSLLRATDNN